MLWNWWRMRSAAVFCSPSAALPPTAWWFRSARCGDRAPGGGSGGSLDWASQTCSEQRSRRQGTVVFISHIFILNGIFVICASCRCKHCYIQVLKRFKAVAVLRHVFICSYHDLYGGDPINKRVSTSWGLNKHILVPNHWYETCHNSQLWTTNFGRAHWPFACQPTCPQVWQLKRWSPRGFSWSFGLRSSRWTSHRLAVASFGFILLQDKWPTRGKTFLFYASIWRVAVYIFQTAYETA